MPKAAGSLITDHLPKGGQPIINAFVTADVFTPGSALPEVVTLTHTGNGIYSGTFANTSVTGTYTIRTHATGLDPELAAPRSSGRPSNRSTSPRRS